MNKLELTVACRRDNTDPDIPPNVNVMVNLAGPLTGLVDSKGNVITGSSYSNSGYLLGSGTTIVDPNNVYPDSSHRALTSHYVYCNSTSPTGTNTLTLGTAYAGRKGYLRATGTRDAAGHHTILEVSGGHSQIWDPQAFPPVQTNIPITLDANGAVTYTTTSAPVIGSSFSYYSAVTLMLPATGMHRRPFICGDADIELSSLVSTELGG